MHAIINVFDIGSIRQKRKGFILL